MDNNPFIRNEVVEEQMAAIIYEKSLGVNSDGEDSDDEQEDDFSSRCLNDSGEGLELEIIDDDQVPAENSGQVYIYIKSC
jgi:hypothetical protein